MDNQTKKENKTISKLLEFDDDFMNRPMIEVKPEEYAYQSNYGDVDITFNIYKIIAENCIYLEDLSNDYMNYVNKNNLDDYYSDVEDYLKDLTGSEFRTDNSFNWDTFNDNVIQISWVKDYYDNEVNLIAISFHIGNDVRAGYSDTLIFKCNDFEHFFYMISRDTRDFIESELESNNYTFDIEL